AMYRRRTAADHAAKRGRDAWRAARFGVRFLVRFRRRVVLLFGGLLLPLWGFAELADGVHEGEGFPFDGPLLQAGHALATPGLDQVMLLASRLGYGWFVVPFDVLLVLVLASLRRVREALFAALALGGSALLNMAAKQVF